MSEEKKVKVYTPNPNFNGDREGVTFTDGVGEADKKTARILVHNYGYSLKPLKSEDDK